MPDVEVLKLSDAISVVKANQTAVDYFIFDEYEIHRCVIPAHSTQDWHIHTIIEETLIVLSGKISVCWIENGEEFSQDAEENSVIRVKRSMHNIENRTDHDAVFWVVRTVPAGIDQRETIKNDKVLMDSSKPNHT